MLERGRQLQNGAPTTNLVPPRLGEGVQVGRYRLFRPLAAGGMATVYLGWLQSEGRFFRPIAAKVMHPFVEQQDLDRRQEMVLDEARIASRIRHQNVVSVIDVVPSELGPVLIMDYVTGDSLSHLLSLARGDVPLAIISRLAIDALEGLHAAHEAVNESGVPLQVVHRDVSPQNILVDEAGVARIGDFGIARALERACATRSGEMRGKLTYMAPEQFGSGPMDRRVDVWGFGMVLWQLLARAKPFADLDAAAIVTRVLSGSVDRPSRPGGEKLVDVCMRALSLDPDDRYPTARLMALDVEKVAPPAAHREVAQWLKKTASSVLRERRATVAEMADLASRGDSPAIDELPATISEVVAIEPPISAARDVRSARSSRSKFALALALSLLLVGGAVIVGGLQLRARAHRTDTRAPPVAALTIAPVAVPSPAEPPPAPAAPTSAVTSTVTLAVASSSPVRAAAPPRGGARPMTRSGTASRAIAPTPAPAPAPAPGDPLAHDQRN